MPLLNPGGGWVSTLCAEPIVFHQVLGEMAAPHEYSSQLRILRHYLPVSADVTADRIGAVAFASTTGGDPLVVTAACVLDASEEGDLLPLTGCEHTLGAESVSDTGELHALDGPADPRDQQALTWCAALEWDPAGDHTIDRPDSYPFWRGYQAPFWPGPQLGWTTQDPETGPPVRRPLFGDDQDLWRFRRTRDGSLYQPQLPDITLVNWPQIDYRLAPVVGVTADDRSQRLAAARELTRCFVYWMQTEAPRLDGGTGYPGLRLTGYPLGTRDGLAAEPYIRESRRIHAESTVVEQHIGVQARPGASEAEQYGDSVGVGSYRIDLHPSTAGRGYLDLPSYPFQIPLGALLPVRIDNLVAAGKCLGVTHVTNGCYRLHPVEWNVGEAAGALAAFALDHRVPPRAVRARPDLLTDFQRLLTTLGIGVRWPDQLRSQQR